MDQNMSSILMMVLLFVVMYFLLIRPENKRKKQAQEMRNSLKKGDIITTIGGIVGKVVAVNGDTFVIETSEDRVRLEFSKWALSTTGVQTSERVEVKKEKRGAEKKETATPVPEEPSVPEISAGEAESEKN